MSDQKEKKARPWKPGDIVITPESGLLGQFTMEGFPGEVFFRVDGVIYKTFIDNSDMTKVAR